MQTSDAAVGKLRAWFDEADVHSSGRLDAQQMGAVIRKLYAMSADQGWEERPGIQTKHKVQQETDRALAQFGKGGRLELGELLEMVATSNSFSLNWPPHVRPCRGPDSTRGCQVQAQLRQAAVSMQPPTGSGQAEGWFSREEPPASAPESERPESARLRHSMRQSLRQSSRCTGVLQRQDSEIQQFHTDLPARPAVANSLEAMEGELKQRSERVAGQLVSPGWFRGSSDQGESAQPVSPGWFLRGVSDQGESAGGASSEPAALPRVGGISERAAASLAELDRVGGLGQSEVALSATREKMLEAQQLLDGTIRAERLRAESIQHEVQEMRGHWDRAEQGVTEQRDHFYGEREQLQEQVAYLAAQLAEAEYHADRMRRPGPPSRHEGTRPALSASPEALASLERAQQLRLLSEQQRLASTVPLTATELEHEAPASTERLLLKPSAEAIPSTLQTASDQKPMERPHAAPAPVADKVLPSWLVGCGYVLCALGAVCVLSLALGRLWSSVAAAVLLVGFPSAAILATPTATPRDYPELVVQMVVGAVLSPLILLMGHMKHLETERKAAEDRYLNDVLPKELRDTLFNQTWARLSRAARGDLSRGPLVSDSLALIDRLH